jgi:hypothetical protein
MSIPDPQPGLTDHWNSYPEALQRLVEELDEESQRRAAAERRERLEILFWRGLVAAVLLASIAVAAIALVPILDPGPHLTTEQETQGG